MEIDKYEDLLEKAKDFDNLRNGGIWKIVEELTEAVEDLLEENSFLSAGTCAEEWKQARAQGMREAAVIAAHRYAVCEDAYSKGLGAEERHCALEAKHIEDKILARAEEIEKDLDNE